jgi:hypothetical protein
MPLSPDTVKAHLATRILALARQVAPDGRVSGREWEGHGPDGSKWGIVITGDKAGRWQNFGSGAAGQSGLSLIRDAFCGGDHRAAWQWALDWLGEAADRPPPASPPPAARLRGLERNAAAIGLFLHAQPMDWDGPVGCYLAGRGIDPAAFGHASIGSLRFHPQCWNVEANAHLPAMVAAVIDPLTRTHIATHRTWLAGGGHTWRKAPLETPKKLLGPGLGGIIPLTRGASGKALGRAPDGDAALLGEGIENTLTVAQWFAERRAIAYVSAGNLAALELPEALADIVLIRDRDGENAAVNQVRRDTVLHWTDEGRTVALWQPPAGHKDANDYWLAELEASK